MYSLVETSIELETSESKTAQPLREVMWEPSEEYKKGTQMYKFLQQSGAFKGYEDLWQWSVDNGDEFWLSLLDFVDVVYEGSPEPVRDGNQLPDVTYFPNVKLNFAENLLRHGAPESPLRDAEALVTISEATDTRKSWSFAELRDDASRVGNALRKHGITSDDSVGAYMPNLSETVIAMLGTTSTGAIWSSVSPDFGVQAVVDRFTQIAPRVLFTANGFVSKGEVSYMHDKIEELVASLPSLEKVVVIDVLNDAQTKANQKAWDDVEAMKQVISWKEFVQSGSEDDGSAPEIEFTRADFAHNQFVLFSSGTTGLPKCIAHGAGNMLLQHSKELILHSDVRPEDRMLFFTTCGWMMWNWMVSSLYAGATVVCFDGFAAYPRLACPWELVASERITHLGTTPRYLQACRRRVRPMRDNNLDALRVIFSTGSPLAPEDFEYVYEHVGKDLMLASISGGTDICSCFALGNPLLPVRKSELQAIGLGLDVCAYDVDEQKSLVGEKGELVCRTPFVAAPVKFYGDDEDKTKYRAAYFREGDPGAWYHGDLVEITGSVGKAGGMIIHGRSDTTLKPGGVRIGTAEVYRFAEEVDVVQDSLVIGDQMKSGKRAGDVRIVLFVQLENNVELTADIEEQIRSTIKTGASDAHVPALIRKVEKIPYTKSGKKVEVAVRDLFAYGKEPKNVGALIDPSAFDDYRKMAEAGL